MVPISALRARAVLAEVGIACVSTRLLTAAEVASMLGVPKSWVYEQSRRGRIPEAAQLRERVAHTPPTR